jgi:hypothetical protein
MQIVCKEDAVSANIIIIVLDIDQERRKRMKFKINNTEWTIEDVDEAAMNNEMKNDGTLGVTIYKTQKIMLLKDQANIIKTLKHELTHVWLYEYGHNQNDDKTFSYEDVCEVLASSNDFINEIVEQYKQNNGVKIEQVINSISLIGNEICITRGENEHK